MSDVTRILSGIEQGDPTAAEQLLPLVYDELRKLAAQKMAKEAPGQTLQPTALVHEAYLRLVGPQEGRHWDNRGHFFAAAAESMRRILVENARRKTRQKRGGAGQRVDLDEGDLVMITAPDQLLAVDDTLGKLCAQDPVGAEVVKLRYFAGFSLDEVAGLLGMSRATAYRHWAYARAWLQCELQEQRGPESE
jgi:RNA polymerase sigma factor (TIGR02999 family)